jgi:2-C-methyl-D-erythritol 4-phosphate cytidylyltransferase/2-C-methyl-D-erythritol 2,4-cyclodiphosphate synthase
MRVAAIVAAGGRGERLGAGVPKQMLDLGGRSILQRSVEAMAGSGLVAETVVVLPETLVAAGETIVGSPGIRVVPGGPRRQDSVALGFDATWASADVVLVHDAARPLVSREIVARTIDAAASFGAAIAAVRSRDTVKRAGSREGREVVVATLPREEIWLAQTPQGFRYEVLREAIALGRRGTPATDEAALAELAGHHVCLVEGDVLNMKITTADDLRLARALLAAGAVGPHASPPVRLQSEGGSPEEPSPGAQPARVSPYAADAVRVGLGYDLHRFARGRRLVLGGVQIPFDFGLAGHSDADAVAHAVTDAILGAAALGDIGSLFPDTAAEWKDADSMAMLAEAFSRVRAAAYAVTNVDVVVIAEAPKIGPYRDAIRRNLARVLGLDPSRVFVKGKTNEGVDGIGRGEALAVQAVAVLRPD